MESISLTEKEDYYIYDKHVPQSVARKEFEKQENYIMNRQLFDQEKNRGSEPRTILSPRLLNNMDQSGIHKSSISDDPDDKIGLVKDDDGKSRIATDNLIRREFYKTDIFGRPYKHDASVFLNKAKKDEYGNEKPIVGKHILPDDPPTYAKGVKFVQPINKEKNRWTGKRKS